MVVKRVTVVGGEKRPRDRWRRERETRGWRKGREEEGRRDGS